MEVDVRGVLLDKNVDLKWLNELTPRFYPDFVKFVVSTKTNRVVVGMDIHASAAAFLDESEDDLYGGNIYRDGKIVYESTLNIRKNMELAKEEKGFWAKLLGKGGKTPDNPRIITDKGLIAAVNAVLFAWVEI